MCHDTQGAQLLATRRPTFDRVRPSPSIEFGLHLRSSASCTFDRIRPAPSIESGLHRRSSASCTFDRVWDAPPSPARFHVPRQRGATFASWRVRPSSPHSFAILPSPVVACSPAGCVFFLLWSADSHCTPSIEKGVHLRSITAGTFGRVRPHLPSSSAGAFDPVVRHPSSEQGLHLRSNSTYLRSNSACTLDRVRRTPSIEFGLHLRSTSAYTFERARPAPSSEHGLHIRSSSAYTFDGMRPAPSIECGLHLRSAGSDLRARIRSRPFPPRPFSIDLGTFVCNGMAVRPFSVIWLDTRGRGASRCMTSPSHIPLCAFGDGLEYSRPCMRIPSPMVACIAWCRNASSGVSVLTGDADMLQWPNGQPLCITGAGVWAFLGACQWRSTTTPHIPKLPARMPIITSTALQEKIFLDHVRSRLLACVQPSSAWVVVSLLIGL